MKGIKLLRRKPYPVQNYNTVTVPNQFCKLHELRRGDALYAYITKDGDLLLSTRLYDVPLYKDVGP